MMFQLKYLVTTLCYFLIALLTLSCGKESSCFKSTGQNTREQRTISDEVNTIILQDKINLVLRKNIEASLSVEGGSNLLPYINTEINGNELNISSDNKCNVLRDYNKMVTVYLSLPSIVSINYTGQGSISSTNTLNLNNFEFETRNGTGSVNMKINANNMSVIQHTGPADITISGSTNFLYAYTGGNGWLYFNNLTAVNSHINHAGTGDVLIKTLNNLLIELTSIGNIDFYGNPKLNISTHSGSGEIRKK